MSKSDTFYLEQAVENARQNVLSGGGPFAAILVFDDGTIIEGVNAVTLNNDPTAHAEVQTIRKAGQQLGRFSFEDAILYSSCEPCPMCLGASLWSRVKRVVFAADRFDAADAGFDDEAFYRRLAEGNVAEEIAVTNKTAPFTQWNTKADRTDY